MPPRKRCRISEAKRGDSSDDEDGSYWSDGEYQPSADSESEGEDELQVTTTQTRPGKRRQISEEKRGDSSDEEEDDSCWSDGDYKPPADSDDEEEDEQKQVSAHSRRRSKKIVPVPHPLTHGHEEENSSDSQEEQGTTTHPPPRRIRKVTPDRQEGTTPTGTDSAEAIPVLPTSRNQVLEAEFDQELEDSEEESGAVSNIQRYPRRAARKDDPACSYSSDEDGGGEEEDDDYYNSANAVVSHPHHHVFSDDESIHRKDPRQAQKCIYCCPICYIETYRRLECNIRCTDVVEDDVAGENADNEDLTLSEFKYGPLETLKVVDPTLQLAGAFCFGKLHSLKLHIQNDHGIANVDQMTNDLYHRFHLSQADGLVQRYQKLVQNMQGLGYMKTYFDHVKEELQALQDGRRQSRRWRQEVRNHHTDASRQAREFEEELTAFWSSFTLRGHRIWEALRYAHSKEEVLSSEEDCGDADEDEEDADNDFDHARFDREQLQSKAEKEERECDEYVKRLESSMQGKDEVIGGSDSEEDEDEEDQEEEPVWQPQDELVDTDDEDAQGSDDDDETPETQPDSALYGVPGGVDGHEEAEVIDIADDEEEEEEEEEVICLGTRQIIKDDDSLHLSVASKRKRRNFTLDDDDDDDD